MKRTLHILALLLGMSFAAASVSAQQKPALPKLHFENSNLQRLADMAEQNYNDPEKFYTFERDLDDWKGKSWQLMMLNYFLIVNDIMNEKSDFLAEEAVKVQNAMFQKYAAGRGMSVPADVVAAAAFTEKQVAALEKDLEYMSEGPQFELNTYAGISKILKQYVAQRLAYSLCDKVGESEVLSFLAQEEADFEYFFRTLQESHGYFLLIEDGGGMYFSMLPLLKSGFAAQVLDYRVQSLKRIAGVLGIADFGNVPFAEDHGFYEEGEEMAAVDNYRQTLRSPEIDNREAVGEATAALDKAVEAYSSFIDSRGELATYIFSEKGAVYGTDTEGYKLLMLRAHASEREY